MEEISELKREGLSIQAISQLTGFDRKTIRKYLLKPEGRPVYGPRSAPVSKLEPFKPYLKERLQAGVWNAQVLLRELRQRNYRGGYTIVHPKYSDRSVIIEVDRLPSVPLVGYASLVHRCRRPRLDVQKLGAASAGEHRLAATTHSFAAFGTQTIETQAHRSNLLDLATIGVDRLEVRTDDRQSGDGCRLAPERLPFVLDMEDTPREARSAQSAARGSRSDSDDEPQQPALGCTAHSPRVAETGHRNHRTHRREVHGATSKATFTEVADLPGQPCEEHGVGGFFRSADDSF